MSEGYGFQNILPDPLERIEISGIWNVGVNTSATKGQPFASYSLSLKQPKEQDRTITGKLINRIKEYSAWSIKINYNPMTKAQFDPIYRFLMQRRGSLKPFFVNLPNYAGPKNQAFSDSMNGGGTIGITGLPYRAGVTYLDITENIWNVDYTAGLPEPGDIFNVLDLYDTLHKKAYMVTKVETNDTYIIGAQPAAKEVRVHFTPGLQRAIRTWGDLRFFYPTFKVVQVQDTTEYSLDTEDLYSFSLRLEEAFY